MLAHGITTVIAGNCGLTLTPIAKEHADFVGKMMARVDGIPIEVLERGVGWDWMDFSGYTKRLEDRTFLEVSPLQGWFSEEIRELLTDMSVIARRPLNWNLYFPGFTPPDICAHQLAVSDYAKSRGGEVAALTMPIPMVIRSSFMSGLVLDSLPVWSELFLLRKNARLAALKDPVMRARMKAALNDVPALMKTTAHFAELIVTDTYTEETAPYLGRSIGDIGRELGQDALDVMLDIVVKDGLRTGLQRPDNSGSDELWNTMSSSWFDPRTVVGGSDAGAHVDALFASNFPLVMIAEARKRKLAPLEQVIHVVSDVPARRFGIRDRGRIADGWHADLVLLDPLQAGSDTPSVFEDLPDGSPRLSTPARGIHHVFVNGVPVLNGQHPMGDLPGTVLHSGKDTQTVELRNPSNWLEGGDNGDVQLCSFALDGIDPPAPDTSRDRHRRTFNRVHADGFRYRS